MKQALETLHQWFSFAGRLGRGDYNGANLIAVILFVMANIIFIAPLHMGMIEGMITLDKLLGWNAWVAGVLALSALIITISSSVRRLHDFGWSGWWLTLGLAPLQGFALFVCALGIIILAFFKGEKKQNEYGDAPAPENN